MNTDFRAHGNGISVNTSLLALVLCQALPAPSHRSQVGTAEVIDTSCRKTSAAPCSAQGVGDVSPGAGKSHSERLDLQGGKKVSRSPLAEKCNKGIILVLSRDFWVAARERRK